MPLRQVSKPGGKLIKITKPKKRKKPEKRSLLDELTLNPMSNTDLIIDWYIRQKADDQLAILALGGTGIAAGVGLGIYIIKKYGPRIKAKIRKIFGLE